MGKIPKERVQREWAHLDERGQGKQEKVFEV